jgi:hypothetical protein
MTYAAAGMVTTREFMVMAAWHLLEREALRVPDIRIEREPTIGWCDMLSRYELRDAIVVCARSSAPAPD